MFIATTYFKEQREKEAKKVLGPEISIPVTLSEPEIAVKKEIPDLSKWKSTRQGKRSMERQAKKQA